MQSPETTLSMQQLKEATGLSRTELRQLILERTTPIQVKRYYEDVRIERARKISDTIRDRPKGAERPKHTHCPNGHEYTEENTAWRIKNGKKSRSCRKCNSERLVAYKRGKRLQKQNKGATET